MKLRHELVLFNREIFFLNFLKKRCLTTLITELAGFGGFSGASAGFRRFFGDFGIFSLKIAYFFVEVVYQRRVKYIVLLFCLETLTASLPHTQSELH